MGPTSVFARTSTSPPGGLPDNAYFSAVARLQDLSPEFSVDLVAMERSPAGLRSAIEAGGVEL